MTDANETDEISFFRLREGQKLAILHKLNTTYCTIRGNYAVEGMPLKVPCVAREPSGLPVSGVLPKPWIPEALAGFQNLRCPVQQHTTM